MYTSICGSFICNSQTWKIKQTVLYPYTGMLFSNNSEVLTCKMMDECKKNYTKWKTKKRTVWFHLRKILEMQMSSDRKQVSGCLGMGKKKTLNGGWRNFWEWGICSLSWVWWWFYGCTQMSNCTDWWQVKENKSWELTIWFSNMVVTCDPDEQCWWSRRNKGLTGMNFERMGGRVLR